LSLQFSDPTAGITTPGTTNYPGYGMRRVGTEYDFLGEEGIRSAVIDTVHGFAYFGTDTIPGRVIKIAFNGSGPPTLVGILELNDGSESNLHTAVIDVAGGYLYFGTSTNPGVVVKVDLNGSGVPLEVGSATMNTGENQLGAGVIDPAA